MWWFALGIVVGILIACLLFWLDKKFFVFSDLLFDAKTFFGSGLERSSSYDAFDAEKDDKPRGKPLSFEEWQKKFVKHG